MPQAPISYATLPELGPVQVDAAASGIMLGPGPERRTALPWRTAHLSFAPAAGASDDPVIALPPVQSGGTALLAALHLRQLQSHSPYPVVVEHRHEARPQHPGELEDGVFLAEVANHADCAIVLDLDRMLAQERRGGATVQAVLDPLPLLRVVAVKVSLAGVEDAMPALVATLTGLPRLRALLISTHGAPGDPGHGDARRLEALQRIWNQRGRRPVLGCRDGDMRVDPVGPTTTLPVRTAFPRAQPSGTGRRQRGPLLFLPQG